MTSQPVIGLPQVGSKIVDCLTQMKNCIGVPLVNPYNRDLLKAMMIYWKVPPSRKQSPFIAKRPQLPPRVPGSNKVQMSIIKGKQ